ncbi:NUDIX domain-containing protein [Niveibacterium sp. SC-1]|uniref:NUDIX hydrolase n=1 Tax=Niveibacterium sp. SC-1 TaxID=3135646 RepID=UPI00311FBE95
MISFPVGNYRFHLRAAAVVVREGAVLLHRAEGDAFWALPGGRVEPGEIAADAVAREMKEELSAEVRAVRLVWVVENFFGYRGESHHEVGLYFLAEPSSASSLMNEPGPYVGREGVRSLEFAWFAPSELAALDVRPSFLVPLLKAQDFSFRHVVHRDEQT